MGAWEQSLDAYGGGYDPERYRQTDPWWNQEKGRDEADDDGEEEG